MYLVVLVGGSVDVVDLVVICVLVVDDYVLYCDGMC